MEHQRKADQFGRNIIATIEIVTGMEVLHELKEIRADAARCHEKILCDIECEEYAVDDMRRVVLDQAMVKKARADEIEYVCTMKLYTKVSISECYRKTGKAPIVVR